MSTMSHKSIKGVIVERLGEKRHNKLVEKETVWQTYNSTLSWKRV